MFIRTAASFRQGARTLPREYYTSEDIFAAEKDAIFGRLWSCVGRSSRLAQAGDYIVAAVADESIIVVRGRDGIVRAFFNVCRHRGTRLCTTETGRFGDVIQCPYHAWTYAIEGDLIGAPHMHGVDGFNRDDYPLHTAAVAESNGFVFVNVATATTPFATWIAPLATRFDRFKSRHASDRPPCDLRGQGQLEARFSELFRMPPLPCDSSRACRSNPLSEFGERSC